MDTPIALMEKALRMAQRRANEDRYVEARGCQYDARTWASAASAEALTRIAEVLETMLEAQAERTDTDSLRDDALAELERVREALGGYPDSDLASLAKTLSKRCDALEMGESDYTSGYTRGYKVGLEAAADTASLRAAAPYPEESDFERGYLCGLKSSDAYQQGLARGREDNAAELEAWQNAPRWEPVEYDLLGATCSCGEFNAVPVPDGYALCRLVPGTEATND